MNSNLTILSNILMADAHAPFEIDLYTVILDDDPLDDHADDLSIVCREYPAGVDVFVEGLEPRPDFGIFESAAF